jgi:hypothetical protein
MILRGQKRVEYRSRPTRRRGIVAIYASKTPVPTERYRLLGLQRGDLPVGVLVGTVNIIGCVRRRDRFEWQLAHPVRYRRVRKPIRRAMPTFFFPF